MQVNTQKLFTGRFLRYPYSQICEITQNLQKIQTKMNNNPVGKQVNTHKNKYLGIYFTLPYVNTQVA